MTSIPPPCEARAGLICSSRTFSTCLSIRIPFELFLTEKSEYVTILINMGYRSIILAHVYSGSTDMRSLHDNFFLKAPFFLVFGVGRLLISFGKSA